MRERAVYRLREKRKQLDGAAHQWWVSVGTDHGYRRIRMRNYQPMVAVVMVAACGCGKFHFKKIADETQLKIFSVTLYTKNEQME